MFKLGPKLEFMTLPNGQFGERIIHPDGKADCWVNGEPCDPDRFEALAEQASPKSSLWEIK